MTNKQAAERVLEIVEESKVSPGLQKATVYAAYGDYTPQLAAAYLEAVELLRKVASNGMDLDFEGFALIDDIAKFLREQS